MDSLFMDCVGVKRELHLTCDFNQAGSILEPITTAGAVGDYVSNQSICGYRTPTWTTPADKIRFQDKRLVASETVAGYTGKVESGFLSNTISWEDAYADQTTDWFKDENGTVALVSITLEKGSLILFKSKSLIGFCSILFSFCLISLFCSLFI